ncbi:hypothetical protein WJX72_005342 [[Myrmecia] bisecta]|uniref:Uncharacterized protein n=1 Tax=[Myrmecia] bisecta TaxID=41462 RepID=A0AAW1QQH4_9CHLO
MAAFVKQSSGNPQALAEALNATDRQALIALVQQSSGNPQALAQALYATDRQFLVSAAKALALLLAEDAPTAAAFLAALGDVGGAGFIVGYEGLLRACRAGLCKNAVNITSSVAGCSTLGPRDMLAAVLTYSVAAAERNISDPLIAAVAANYSCLRDVITIGLLNLLDFSTATCGCGGIGNALVSADVFSKQVYNVSVLSTVSSGALLSCVLTTIGAKSASFVSSRTDGRPTTLGLPLGSDCRVRGDDRADAAGCSD